MNQKHTYQIRRIIENSPHWLASYSHPRSVLIEATSPKEALHQMTLRHSRAVSRSESQLTVYSPWTAGLGLVLVIKCCK